jgi:hypothetical protein
MVSAIAVVPVAAVVLATAEVPAAGVVLATAAVPATVVEISEVTAPVVVRGVIVLEEASATGPEEETLAITDRVAALAAAAMSPPTALRSR